MGGCAQWSGQSVIVFCPYMELLFIPLSVADHKDGLSLYSVAVSQTDAFLFHDIFIQTLNRMVQLAAE